jgi:tRNA nucleotidyltransferase (CCA-adding enzyme)
MDGRQVLAALEREPGGREVLGLEQGMLVGGAVRDLVLGAVPRELDVVVPEDAEGVAERLARLLGERAQVTGHGRFGTAAVRWPGGRIDVAARRAESYPAPGALPEVRAGTVEEDLLRRDFTVNAIAVALAGGAVHAAPGALEDLAARRLRVLHEQSFLDDPTRLLRLARYAARLRFEIESETERLARAAVTEGALETVSGARIGAELRLALAEADALGALSRMDELGIVGALGLQSPVPETLARDALALLPADGRPGELLMAVLTGDRGRLDWLEFPAAERDRIATGVRRRAALARTLVEEERASKLHEALAGATPEAVALAGASAGVEGREAAQRWLSTLRHVRLAISGDDLLAAGVRPGPELGRRLARALALKLDGQLAGGADAEVAAAMEEEG